MTRSPMTRSPSPPLPIQSVEECWASLSGHRMRYLCAGSGRPLLLIHGLLGYSFSWRFNLAEFARHATVHAVDLPGTGFSDRAVLDCSLRATAERLAHFLDQLGIREFDLLGTSHGGAVAMMLAALDPRRVRRLVLPAPANPWSSYGRRLAPFLASVPVRFLVPHLVRSRSFRNFQLRRMYGDRARISPGTLEGYSAPISIPGTTDHVLRILEGWNAGLEEVRRILPTIADIPTLLLWGTRDVPVSFASAGTLQAQFRRAELVIFDGAGHLPYEEVPDAFNRAVLDFLTR